MSDTDKPDTGAQSGDGEGQAQSGHTGNPGDGAQSGADKTQDAEKTVSQADYDAMRERMRAADQRAAQREAELKALRDKDLPEAEKLKKDYAETTERVKDLESRLREARLQNAFLSANTYTWHDPEAALKLADMSGVEIDDDGKVTGLKEALAALAKSKPYLVKTETSSESDDKVSKDAGAGPGNPPMNGKPSDGTAGKKDLRRRFSRGLNVRS